MKRIPNIIYPAFALFAFACFALSPQARADCREGCEELFSTFLGEDALENNFSGFYNTANGYNALLINFSGSFNTATGGHALASNTDGDNNTANGYLALEDNETGSNNTAVGVQALSSNTSGSNNIAIGLDAGSNITTGSDNISIGANGGVAESGFIRIGTRNTQTNAFIAGIWGRMITNSAGVIVDSKGHLGTIVSSERYKAEIKAMDQASEAIFSLQPVTFHYKKELDPEGIPQFGLVAEQVEKINRDLVVRDDQDKPYTVRYEAVNAMLLNEFLKEHREVQKLKKQVEALAAGLQKVSAELELSQSGSQTVLNNR